MENWEKLIEFIQKKYSGFDSLLSGGAGQKDIKALESFIETMMK